MRDTPLTGLSTAAATPITAADSVLSAAGKLQGQASANATAIAGKANTAHGHAINDVAGLQTALDAKLDTVDAPTAVRGTTLTGLSTTTAMPITSADTVLTAAGKLQAQITAHSRRAKVPAVSGRFYSSCNFGAAFSSGTVTANQRRTITYEPLSDMRIDQIGVVLAAAAATAGLATLAVYEFDAVNPAQLNLLHNFGEIAVDTAIGAKMITADYTFLVGRTYVFALHVSQTFGIRTVPATTQLATGLATSDGTQNIFWFAPVAYSSTPAATIDTNAQSAAGSAAVLIVMRAA